MERNIKVARAHRALSWLYGFLVLVLAGLALFADDVPFSSMALVVLLFAVVFLVHHFTARAARDGRPGARVASLVIGILMLAGFPVGTLIGLYLIANAWSPWPAAMRSDATVA